MGWSRRRTTILIGEDGIHPRRTQEHLQRKGKVGGKLVIFLNYAFPFYKFFQKKTISSSYILLLKCWFLHIFFNLIALINLLSMDIDSFLTLPHPNQNICMHWSGVY